MWSMAGLMCIGRAFFSHPSMGPPLLKTRGSREGVPSRRQSVLEASLGRARARPRPLASV